MFCRLFTSRDSGTSVDVSAKLPITPSSIDAIYEEAPTRSTSPLNMNTAVNGADVYSDVHNTEDQPEYSFISAANDTYDYAAL